MREWPYLDVTDAASPDYVWDCDACGKPVKARSERNDEGVVRAIFPASYYWSRMRKEVYCGPDCSLTRFNRRD